MIPSRMIEAVCKACRMPFSRYKSQMGAGYCSYACRETARRERRVRAGEARCNKCGEWKAIDLFSRINDSSPKRHPDARHSICRPCSSKDSAHWQPAIKLTDEQRKLRRAEKSRVNNLRRRASGPAPHKFDIGRMFCMQDAQCIYCLAPLAGSYHIDHKTPVSRGGKNDLPNLHLTCPQCNLAKGAMTHEEFLVSKRRRLPRTIRPKAMA